MDAPRAEIGGKRYSRICRAPGTYYPLAGPVVVERALYRRDGERSARTVDAISLRAGVVGRGWPPKTARAMAHMVQAGTSREAEPTARELGRLPYARASFERVAHEVGEDWLDHYGDIEDRVVREMPLPEGTRSVSVSLAREKLRASSKAGNAICSGQTEPP